MPTPTTLTPEIRDAWLAPLTLRHDGFLELCMNGNIVCMNAILRIILDKPDLEVIEVTVQKTLPNQEGGHEARVDVFARDAAGRLYDIEMQMSGRMDELKPRLRHYCNLLGIASLQRGESYGKLPELWVIIILDQDMFGLDWPLYTIERCVLGAAEKTGRELPFGDGEHIVVVNGARQEEDTDLSRLLHDLGCADPEKMYIPELAETVRRYKDSTGGEQVDAFLKKLQDEGEERGIKKGREEGREETLRSFVFNLLSKGLPLDTIAEYTSLSLEKVQALAAEAAAAKS